MPFLTHGSYRIRYELDGPERGPTYVLVNGQVAFEGTAKSLEGDAALQARLLGVVQKEAA